MFHNAHPQFRACNFGFRLQIETRLQPWIAGHLHFEKSLQFCFMAEVVLLHGRN